MRKTNQNETRRSTAFWIVTLVSLLVWTETAGASFLGMLSGSPVSSVPCSSCTLSETFNLQTTLRQPYFVTSAVWSADGKYLSIAGEFERNINVYDTSNWEIVSHVLRDSAAGDDNSVIQFDDADDDLLIPRINTPSYEDVSIEKWSLKSSSSLQKYVAEVPQNGTLSPIFDVSGSEPVAIAVSATGNLMASSIADDVGAYISVFEESDGQIIDTIACGRISGPKSLAFSKDETEVIIGGCHLNDVEGYNVRTGQMTFQTRVDPGNWLYNFISHNTSGSLVAVGSSDSGSGTVTILKSEDGSIVETLPRKLATITNLQWINDHLILVSYDAWHPEGSMARIWDINSRSVVAAFGGKHLQLVSISPDSHQLAAIIGNDVYIGTLKNMSSGN